MIQVLVSCQIMEIVQNNEILLAQFSKLVYNELNSMIEKSN